MKDGIHPEYVDATISCACGNVAQIKATVAQMHVDVCGKCHPFYTGRRQQLVDRGGRIEQFNKRYGLEQEAPASGEAAAAPEGEPAEATAEA